MVTLSNAAAITVTLPQNTTTAFPIGAEIDFLWLGVGQPTFAAGSGATAGATPGLKLRAPVLGGDREEDLHERLGRARRPQRMSVGIMASGVVIAVAGGPTVNGKGAEGGGTSGTSFAPTMPAGVTVGELLLCAVVADNPGATDLATVSTGWSRIMLQASAGPNIKMAVFAKIATGIGHVDGHRTRPGLHVLRRLPDQWPRRHHPVHRHQDGVRHRQRRGTWIRRRWTPGR